MEVAYSRIIIYSWLIFGSGISCDRKLEKRQSVSSCSENNDDNFFCANGLCIEWSLVCDGHNDCSDGSDEAKYLCSRYEYGTKMEMECGKEDEDTSIDGTPWLVYIHKLEPRKYYIGIGTIIAPNVVIAMAESFWRSDLKYKRNIVNDGGRYLYNIEIAEKPKIDNPFYINAEMIYFVEDLKKDGANGNELAVIVLADKISFNNGVLPICIDWYRKYNVPDHNQFQIFSTIRLEEQKLSTRKNTLTGHKLYIDSSSCRHMYDSYNFADSETNENFCIRIIYEKKGNELAMYQTLSILHSDNYFLTGLKSFWTSSNQNSVLGFIDIKYYVPWIRGILNKHATLDRCILRAIEGVIYSFKYSGEILTPGTFIVHQNTVNETCEVGYHKTYLNSYRVCQSNGKWKTVSEKLCLKMCPPLLSDSLDIKCSYNGKYSNCSNLSIPDTKVTTSCKASYSAPDGQENTPLELVCQSNGKWNKQLYTCKPLKLCVLPSAEGVVYTYEDSYKSIPHGTSINHPLTVNESCEVGYHKVYPKSYRVCQSNGKWKTVSDQLCLKMCPPLLSDSLDIKCNYNGNYANCLNPSIPDTIASPSCKPSYSAPDGQEDTPLELVCQSNGKWNKRLYTCKPAKLCVLPSVEGVVYTYEDSFESLPHGTLINHTLTVNENCEVGYHNAYPNSFRVCQRNGKWKSISEKLCLKMCPPLLSDSLDIKCIINGKVTKCSNPSIPDTIASPSCKPSFTAPDGQGDTPLELVCQSNGKWNKQLYTCKPPKLCVLPSVEGVVYTYEDSFESLPHGTLINHTLTVNENCEVGYHNAYPNSFRVCQKNGKWLKVSENICLKMCPPLLSDSLDIKCTLNGKVANCSNPSIPDTIASPSCKPFYSAPNGREDTSLVLVCQSDGKWNNQLYTCKKPNLCVLPTVEGIVFTYEHSNESLPHGTLVNPTITVNEDCEVGYHKAQPNGFRVCQKNGKWRTVSENLCQKMCPPLVSESLDIKCTYNGKYANCSNLLIPDTIASPSCKTTHSLPNGQAESPLDIHCQSNGIWNNRLYRCEPICGKVYTKENGLINNGQNASVGTAPWNVGIYRFNEKNSKGDMICGGSIISPSLVVSAAHCFWENGMISNTILVKDGLYKIAVGKYTRDFTVIDNQFTKTLDVEIVYLTEHFYGPSGRLAEDIAIVKLKNRISFSVAVAPVCVDWYNKYTAVNGNQGKIVGWGTTEKGIPSPVLLETSLPYVNNSYCRRMFENGFESYVTFDKFCAGSASVSGEGVDKGDSGAGLCFLHYNLYYLTGVVSSKDPETKNSIALFTEIKYHIDFIRNLFLTYQ